MGGVCFRRKEEQENIWCCEETYSSQKDGEKQNVVKFLFLFFISPSMVND